VPPLILHPLLYKTIAPLALALALAWALALALSGPNRYRISSWLLWALALALALPRGGDQRA